MGPVHLGRKATLLTAWRAAFARAQTEQEPSISPQTAQREPSIPRQTLLQSILKWTMSCGARVGSSRHVAWVLRVIHFGLDALPANPRNRRAIIIGGSIATHLKLLEAMGSIIERFGHATMVRPLGEGVQTIGDYDFH